MTLGAGAWHLAHLRAHFSVFDWEGALRLASALALAALCTELCDWVPCGANSDAFCLLAGTQPVDPFALASAKRRFPEESQGGVGAFSPVVGLDSVVALSYQKLTAVVVVL